MRSDLGPCSIEGCERPQRSRGWCEAHYYRVRRTGAPGPALIWDRKRPECKVEGCDERHFARGYCQGHDYRARTWGSPHLSAPVRRGESANNWKGDGITYAGAHDRVRAARGRARDNACVDCGSEARHWSYNHLDPDDRTDDYSGLIFSTDPAMYDPRCVSCHRKFDLRVRALMSQGVTAADLLAQLRETREADQAHRFAEALGRAR